MAPLLAVDRKSLVLKEPATQQPHQQIGGTTIAAGRPELLWRLARNKLQNPGFEVAFERLRTRNVGRVVFHP